MRIRLPSRVVYSLALACSLTASAEDIDLFLGGTPGRSGLPNLLLVLDNGANFTSNSTLTCQYNGDTSVPSLTGSKGVVEQCALYNVIRDLPVNADNSGVINVGFMGFNQTPISDINGQHCGGTEGGCLMVPLREMNATNKAAMLAWIKSWKTTAAGSGYRVGASGDAVGATMQEAWAYFAGKRGLSGRDYQGVGPSASCASNYVVFVANALDQNGKPGDTGKADVGGALSTALVGQTASVISNYTALIGGTYATPCTRNNQSPITIPDGAGHSTRGFWADEWARFMNAGLSPNPKITTYTIGVLNPSTCDGDYPVLLDSMARVGGGKYFATQDTNGLAFALGTIVSEVKADNSVFASVSLPVSVNTQGTYLNQVFIGMFRPDPDALPRWGGNLKQYKLGLTDPKNPDTLRLFDADDRSAISASTGFITDCARSFWTPTAVDNYWRFGSPIGDCGSVAGDEFSNYPDGQWVEKGGQAFVQRQDPFQRTLRACSSLACASLANFSTSVVTNSDLGVTSDAARASLVDWVLGQDTQNEDKGTNANAVHARPSLHGDVVHSRPVAIDFRANENDRARVVVFYGANDGILRAINGNRGPSSSTQDIGGKKPGAELWAFVAPEFYPQFRRLQDNAAAQSSDRVKFFNSTLGTAKPYGLDGPITSWQGTVSGSKVTRLYVTARRGGRVLYGFDVSGIANDTFAQPTLLWRRGCPVNLEAGTAANDTGCSTGFTDLGQTWSSPVLMEVDGYANPLIVMGGGYDPCEDTDSATTACTSSAKGRSLFLIDAVNGTLVRRFTLPGDTGSNPARSIVADVFVVKNRTTGKARWAYTVDMGGNIYRLSGSTANTMFEATAPANWTITKVASLGPGRKFHFAPDIVDNEDGTYALLLGSGDREKPLTGFTNAVAAQNYFFMIKDNPASAAWLEAERTTCGGNNWICLASLKPAPSSGGATMTPSDKGWSLALSRGEQVVTSAITIFGVTTFSTHRATDALPTPAQQCQTNLGEARVYNVGYADAVGAVNEQGARSEKLVSGGLPPSPVAGLVKLDSGVTVPFLIGGSASSALEGSPPKTLNIKNKPKARKYWFIQK